MDNNNEIRPLTETEKAEWLVNFLEQQVESYQQDLEVAKVKLKTLQDSKRNERSNRK